MKPVSNELILKVLNDVKGIKVDEMQLDENLVDLGMDSKIFIQLIIKLEETFECEIPDEKLLITEMNTVQKMIDVLLVLYEEWEENENNR